MKERAKFMPENKVFGQAEGGVLLLENNMEILSNKISYFDSIEH